MESRRIEINMQPLGSVQTKVATESWTESFQDLRSWCHQPHQDELHTPQVINNDEFNFSTDVYVKDLDEPSHVDSEGDPWGNDIFGTCQTLGEENNNNHDSFILTKLPYNYNNANNNNSKKMYQLNNFVPTVKSPLKPSGEDILLSQSSLQQPLKVEVDKSLLVDFQEPSPYSEQTDVRLTEDSNLSHFKIPGKDGYVERKERPKLQLNITAAAATATRTNPNISLRTPDVLQPVLDTNGCDFDLVRFLDPGDEFRNLVVQSCEDVTDTLTKDHDYTESWPGRIEDWRIKAEPLSPVRDEKIIVTEHQYNKTTIPEVVKTESGRPVKRPRKDSSSDYVLDSDVDFSDDDSMDWSPHSSKSAKKKKGGPKRKQKEKTGKRDNASVSDAESAVSFDKYRELRDRNNEASRRSRYNRKQRDYEMRTAAEKLEKDNIKLKRRAERMEKLVEELRATIMKSVTSRNVQSKT